MSDAPPPLAHGCSPHRRRLPRERFPAPLAEPGAPSAVIEAPAPRRAGPAGEP